MNAYKSGISTIYGPRLSKRERSRLTQPKSSRQIPHKVDENAPQKPEPGRVLIKDGKWLVPEDQRPMGWQGMALTTNPKPLQPPIQQPKTRSERREFKRKLKSHRINKSQLAAEFRMHPTSAESRLWSVLCNRQLGVTCKFQVPILGFIVDFYFPSPRKLVIEVDGSIHETKGQKQWDACKDRVLRRSGFRVMRFTNQRVTDDLLGVIREIAEAARISPPTQLPGSRCTSAAGGSDGKRALTEHKVSALACEPALRQEQGKPSGCRVEPVR